MTSTDIRAVVEQGFRQAPFLVHLGVAVDDCGPGYCEASLAVQPQLLQHSGYVHAGVLATLGDHCAGAAAMTMAAAESSVLTVEFKINLLRPAQGERLRCRAKLLKPGRSFSIVESEIFAERSGAEPVLVAKLTATLAIVPLKQAR